nr:uncharacterized protein LOC113827079 [Penaeus vannamei]
MSESLGSGGLLAAAGGGFRLGGLHPLMHPPRMSPSPELYLEAHADLQPLDFSTKKGKMSPASDAGENSDSDRCSLPEEGHGGGALNLAPERPVWSRSSESGVSVTSASPDRPASPAGLHSPPSPMATSPSRPLQPHLGSIQQHLHAQLAHASRTHPRPPSTPRSCRSSTPTRCSSPPCSPPSASPRWPATPSSRTCRRAAPRRRGLPRRPRRPRTCTCPLARARRPRPRAACRGERVWSGGFGGVGLGGPAWGGRPRGERAGRLRLGGGGLAGPGLGQEAWKLRLGGGGATAVYSDCMSQFCVSVYAVLFMLSKKTSVFFSGCHFHSVFYAAKEASTLHKIKGHQYKRLSWIRVGVVALQCGAWRTSDSARTSLEYHEERPSACPTLKASRPLRTWQWPPRDYGPFCLLRISAADAEISYKEIGWRKNALLGGKGVGVMNSPRLLQQVRRGVRTNGMGDSG